MGVARFGQGALPTWFARRVCRGDQAQKLHEFSGALKTCQVTQFGHQGDGHGALPPTQRLEGFDHRGQTPGLDVILPFLFETLAAVGRLLNRSDVFLKDDVLSRCGAAHLREPPQVGRAPIGPACVTEIVSEQEGFEPELGVFAITEGIFTCPSEIAPRFIFHRGDLHSREVPRAGPAGQLHRVPPVGLEALPGFLGNQ